MNALHNLLWNLGSHPVAVLILGLVGVLITAVSVAWIVRRRLRPDPGASSIAGLSVFSVIGILLMGLAALVVRERPQGFENLVQGDYADEGKLAKLQTADFKTAMNREETDKDWSQWRGPRRDGISREAELRLDWPKDGLPMVWRAPLGGGFASVAVADGKLYAVDKSGDEERVLCLEAETGKQIWMHRYPVDYADVEYGTGPRATPTVHDGRVYTLGATGVFLCLDAAPEDGKAKVHWQKDLVSEFSAEIPRWGFASSPLVEGDLVVVQPGADNASVAAFDRRTGKMAWKALDDKAGYSSPVLATCAGVRQVICLTGEGLAGLGPNDGHQLWYYRWSTDFHANVATPIVAGDYVFISSGYGAGCALVELSSDGAGGVRVAPIYTKRNKVMRSHHSTCVLRDGFLYGYDNDYLKCVDVRTAEEKWVTRDVGKGCVLYADGHLLALTQDGVLALIEASPEKFQKKAEMQVFKDASQVWALPALVSNRLYLRDGKELVCLDLSK